MKYIKEKKGVELSLETIVIFIILIIVLIIIIYFFTTHYSSNNKVLIDLGNKTLTDPNNLLK